MRVDLGRQEGGGEGRLWNWDLLTRAAWHPGEAAERRGNIVRMRITVDWGLHPDPAIF